jgi:hypothetical protein
MGDRMTRIAIMDRADMNAEQARVYDAAKASSGIVGGPYHAYIRLPKLFEACQDLRASLSSGPLSRREQQIVNLVVARHWSARYPWFTQVRASLPVGIERPVIDAVNARKLRIWPTRASEPASSWRASFSQTRASATKPMPPRKRPWGWRVWWR